MKIVVPEESPDKRGASNHLAEQFIRGAKERGIPSRSSKHSPDSRRMSLAGALKEVWK